MQEDRIFENKYAPPVRSEKKIGNLYLHGSKKAFLCTLAEEKLEEIEMKNNEMYIELEPFKIATVFFKL